MTFVDHNLHLRCLILILIGELVICGGPSGIRTRVAALKGLCPRPLDDGTILDCSAVLVNRGGLEPPTPGLKVRCSTD